jgi:hypothetical protein
LRWVKKERCDVNGFSVSYSKLYSNPFSLQRKSAAKKEFQGLLKRNSHLRIRIPQSTSNARVKGFNPENVR